MFSEVLLTFLEETRLAPQSCTFLVNGTVLDATAYSVVHAYTRQNARGRGRWRQPEGVLTASAVLRKLQGGPKRAGGTGARARLPPNKTFDVDVVVADAFGLREKQLFHLNKLSQRLALRRACPIELPISVELLDRVMRFLGAAGLWACSRVNSLWHSVSVRRAMLT